MTKEKTTTDEAILNMRLPSELHERAKTRAKSRGVSLAGYMRQLLIDDLEKAAKPASAGSQAE